MRNGGAHFHVDEHSGDVVLLQKLDRETVASYSLAVSARDHGVPVKSAETTLEVLIIDVNDQSPSFAKPHYRTSVLEEQAPSMFYSIRTGLVFFSVAIAHMPAI